MNPRLKKHFILLILILLIVGLVFTPGVRAAVEANAWSLQSLPNVLAAEGNLTYPPVAHPHGALWQARAALHRDQPRAALGHLENLRDSDDPLLLDAMAKAYYQLKEYSQAFELWKEIGHREALRSAGQEAESVQEFDLAVYAYETALEIVQEDIQVWIDLGWAVYSRDESPEEAAVYFNKVIEISPDEGSGYYAMGVLQYRVNEYLAAIEWFEKAIRLAPNNRWYRLRYANTHRHLGLFDQALSIYESIIDEFPEFPNVYSDLAWAYFQQDKFPQAAVAIETALVLMDPPNTWFYYRAGMIYEHMGDYDEALESYQNALSIFPDNNAARQGVDRISGDQ